MSLVECRASSRLNGSHGFVRDIPGEHRPDDTSILVGERDGRDDGEIDSTMAEIPRKERGGALIVPEVFTAVHRDAIVAAAAKHRVPAIYPNRISSTRSELITYGVDSEDLFRDAAVYVDRLLRGANPTDLPVQNPTKFLLTINLPTVKSLGLTIQPNLLGTADEVIE